MLFSCLLPSCCKLCILASSCGKEGVDFFKVNDLHVFVLPTAAPCAAALLKAALLEAALRETALREAA